MVLHVCLALLQKAAMSQYVECFLMPIIKELQKKVKEVEPSGTVEVTKLSGCTKVH